MSCISAICVTHSSRWGLLQRAILNFMDQHYMAKELLVVTNEPGYADQIKGFFHHPGVQAIMEGPGKPKPWPIRVYLTPRLRTPTDMLLHAAVWAVGNYLCCWDDDNLSHPDRLEQQLRQTPPETASVLGESLYHFHDSQELFVSEFVRPTGRPSERCAAGSLLFHRGLLPEMERLQHGSWAAQVVDRAPYRILHMPGQFLTGSNGDNARGDEFHRGMGSGLAQTWTREQILARQSEIEAWLQGYCFSESVVDVCGRDAQACTIDVPVWPSWVSSVTPPEDWHLRLPTRKLQAQLHEERRQSRPARPNR
jgi:hypothetical protein